VREDEAAPLSLGRAGPASSRWRPSRIELELTGLIDGAPAVGDGATAVGGGGSLRFVLGGRYLAGTLAVSALGTTDAQVQSIGLSVVRVPFDAGLRALLPRGRFDLGGDLGLMLGVLRLSAPAAVEAGDTTRLDSGLRVGAFVRVWVSSRVALQLMGQMLVSFQTYVLSSSNLGTLGSSPRLWVSGGLGLAVRL
jgi:hypothetical protein